MYLESVTHLPLVPILKPFRSRLGKLFEIVVRYKETHSHFAGIVRVVIVNIFDR